MYQQTLSPLPKSDKSQFDFKIPMESNETDVEQTLCSKIPSNTEAPEVVENVEEENESDMNLTANIPDKDNVPTDCTTGSEVNFDLLDSDDEEMISASEENISSVAHEDNGVNILQI